MIHLTPNLPEVVAEVRELFERYERALIDKDVRSTLGRDLATVNLEFKVRGRELIGRQSQTWVRFPDLGWKVIAAHVSTLNEAPRR